MIAPARWISLCVLLTAAACSDPDPTPSDADVSPDVADTSQLDIEGDADSGADTDAAEVTVEPLNLVSRPEPGAAYAGLVAEAEHLLKGPKADGQLGDIKLFNHHIAVIVEGARVASGYRAWGGNVADVAAYRADGTLTEDSHGEIGFTWNLQIFEPRAVEIVNDGRDGQPAHARVTGVLAPLPFAQSFLGFIASAEPFAADAVMDYRLGAGDRALTQTVTITSTDTEPASVDLPILLSSQGDGMFHWLDGVGFDAGSGLNPSIAMGGVEAAHALHSRDSSLTFLVQETGVLAVLEDAFVLAPGESIERRYARVVSAKGVNGLTTASAELGLGGVVPATLGTVEGTVALPATYQAPEAHADAWVALFRAGTDKAQTMGPIGAQGAFSLTVPAGDYDAEVFVPGHAVGARQPVTVVAGQVANLSSTVAAAGQLNVTVKTSDDAPVPARIMAMVPQDDTTTPSPYPSEEVDARGPGQWGWSGGLGRVSAVGYAIDGTTRLTVPAGTYEVYATRGLTHSVASQSVTVGAGESLNLAFTVDRVVDTDGWVAGDLHIHALRSPDSYVPHAIRAQQAIAEDLQAPIITEHTAIFGLGDTLAQWGLQDMLLNVPGQEVSTVVFGHFNAFPLTYDANAANGGGVVEHGKTAAELFTAISAQGPENPYIQVNHPRSTPIKGYFTYHDFNRETGEPDKVQEDWTTDFDGVEVFNGGCGVGEAFEDWVAMTNLGLGKALSSGSDAHDRREIIGIPRQVAKIDYAAVEMDPQAFADALKARRSIVSCGPMVTFEAADGTAGMGEMASAGPDGSVAFRVTVSAPAWQELVEVRLRRNGVVVDTVPILDTAPGLRLDTVMSDSPESDAWYMIEVVGTGTLWPVASKGPPAAFTNPIEVDADGDGTWTPPGLGAAL